MPSDKLPLKCQMSLSGLDVLWVMEAACFEMQSTGLALHFCNTVCSHVQFDSANLATELQHWRKFIRLHAASSAATKGLMPLFLMMQ